MNPRYFMKNMGQERGSVVAALILGLIFFSGCSDDADTDAAGDSPTGGVSGSGGGDGGGASGGMSGAGGMSPMGCADNSECAGRSICDPATSTCLLACVNDDECGVSQRCEGGVCIPRQSCGAESPCPDGQACDCDGYCAVAEGNPCVRDLQCEALDYCDTCLGHCRPRAPQCGRCRDDSACDSRSVCHPIGREGYGHCVRKCQGSCGVVGPGYACEEVRENVSACVPNSRSCDAVLECEEDADCPAGRFCNLRRECQPGCVDDTGCPNGELCQGVRCAPPCMNDDACEGAAVCGEDGRCTIPNGCATSADCAEAQTYCDRATNMCVPGCEVDNDCLDAGLQCVAGNCVERGCSGNYQCGFGEVCNLETSECEMAMGQHCAPDCDPMSMMACGAEGSYCISLQDEDENPQGDFCFEPCAPSPNECPQGYRCTEIQDEMGNPVGNVCVRPCYLNPFN